MTRRGKKENQVDKALTKMAKDFCSWGKGGKKKEKHLPTHQRKRG